MMAMDQDTVSSSISDGAAMAPPLSASTETMPNDRPRRRQQRRRPTKRRRRTSSHAAAAATAILAGAIALCQQRPSRATTMEIVPPVPSSSAIDRRGLEVGGTITRDGRSSAACDPATQHTLLFTLYTDAHSIHDNHWKFSHASFGVGLETGNSGTHVASESVSDGNLGYGAVVTHTVCADRATVPATTESSSSATTAAATDVGSCYDLELRDENGDGLTAPHSGEGGLAGGFSLRVDGHGVAAVEHRGKACNSDDDDEWNSCAIENGFESCAVRVCVLVDGSGGTTVSNLGGSQCSLDRPCPSDPATSSVSVMVDTDSYADEISYEVRRSSRSDPGMMDRATENELILAGGNPVYMTGTDDVILGQLGVGAALLDNESYESSMCLPAEPDEDTCYDFRAYDAYGDGMGCGADGTLSIVIETPDERWKLEQKDRDMARMQDVDGEKVLACTDKERLSKWSYCAVRVCADGTVEGLEGNQCDFGMGDSLIDEDYLEEKVDPLAGIDSIRPQSGGGFGGMPEKDEVTKIEVEDFKFDIIDDTDNIDGNEGDQGKNQVKPEPIDEDPTWAEYYEKLQPGFVENGAFQQPNPASEPYQDNRPDKNGGNKGPRPNAAKLDNQGGGASKRPRPNKGKKGPRPNAAKMGDKMKPNSSNAYEQGREDPIILPLKPFTANLLEVDFPQPARLGRADQLSSAIATFLLEHFADEADISTPMNFNLDCTKSRGRVGPEERWVVDCEGEAVYPPGSLSSLPRMKVLNRTVRDAFVGESKEDFLKMMYDRDDSSPPPGNSNKESTRERKKRLKKEKLQRLKQKQKQKQKQQMQQQSSSGTTVNININQFTENKQDKKQAKQDRLKQQKQQKQDGELNVMGYVSGTQQMNQMSDTEKGYALIDGNIHVW
eukprot:CAMPEP_0181107902 /NCGR_PEP_ID=MMETSP1071-20121207/17334_1 /TAXON_ID=35127 /ORGANISM="Thalassiosira sp., Strain NH16" /LENGTH=894 /DNA_ID=CAMNT_0023191449 /DNA_START=62 /DNA_END=2743 /DNA_ORIENTATION=+